MGKRLFSGDTSPLPDKLRCRRSDGRQWRCPQPVKSGLSFCEYHYQQVRRNQDSIKNTSLRRLLPTADPQLIKKRRRRRTRKDPPTAEPILMEEMQEGETGRESSDTKTNNETQLSDQVRARQSDGREWQRSHLAVSVLNSCDGRKLRCKQPNEEDEVIEPKPKRSPRLGADLITRAKRRHRRQKGETRAGEPIRNAEHEEVKCAKKAIGPALTRGLPIPDALRCRRSDGRKWRCKQPAMPGVSFCEYHQMRCKQTYSKSIRAKVVKLEWRSQVAADLRRPVRRQRPRQLMGEQPVEKLVKLEQNENDLKATELATPPLNLHDKDFLLCKEDSSESNEEMEELEVAERSTPEEVEAIEPATPSFNVCDNDQLCMSEVNKTNDVEDTVQSTNELSLPDHLRCRRSDGRKWRCPQLAMPNLGFCEYHYLLLRRNQGKRKGTILVSATKRKRGLHLVANPSLTRKRRRRRQREDPMSAAQKEKRDKKMVAANLEITRDLPNGVMAISPAPGKGQINASSPRLNRKIGSDDGYLLGRRFRSKNAELVPLGKHQVQG